MKRNPADEINTAMWSFLMTHGQKANPQRLKETVYDLIGMTTQKTAGQRHVKKDLNWKELGMTLMDIAIEATALVLSGMLDGEEQWISVENGGEMPKENEWVPATVKRHFWTYEGEEHPEVIYTTLAVYDGMWRFLDIESDYTPWVTDADDCSEENPSYPMAEVIAWMPLPRPYRKEGSQNERGR